MDHRNRAAGVPPELLRTGNRVVRPGDFADLYTNPRAEFTRMVETGVLERIAHGYYLVIPEDFRGHLWRPEIEAIALGVAVADYGRDGAALTGPAAARVLGAIPRALAVATVAIPKQRPMLRTQYGNVQFVKRQADRLDRQKLETDVVTGWTTTPEQTALDLADRPALGGITPDTAAEAIRNLARRANLEVIERLASDQRKRGAWQRFCWIAGIQPPKELRYGVPTLGLQSRVRHPSDYGLAQRAA